MEEFKIKYQKGSDIYIEKIKAKSKEEAIYLFYMNNRNVDILEIKRKEVGKDGTIWFYKQT